MSNGSRRLPLPGKAVAIAGVLQLARGRCGRARDGLGRAGAGHADDGRRAGEGARRLRQDVGLRGDEHRTDARERTAGAARPAGVTLADLGKTIAGPPHAAHHGRARSNLDLRIPLSNAVPASTLLEHLRGAAGTQRIRRVVLRRCVPRHAPQFAYTIDLWVDGQQLRIGKKGKSADGVAVPMTAIGAELAKTEATFSFWGRGTLYGQPLGPMPKLPGMPMELMIGLRAMSALNEIGGAFRLEGDKLKIVFEVRTMWANPTTSSRSSSPSRRMTFSVARPATRARRIAGWRAEFAVRRGRQGGHRRPDGADGGRSAMLAAVAIRRSWTT